MRGEPPLEPAQSLLAGRESGLALDERLERLDVLVVRHLQVDGALVVADVEVQHPEAELEKRRVKFAMPMSCLTEIGVIETVRINGLLWQLLRVHCASPCDEP